MSADATPLPGMARPSPVKMAAYALLMLLLLGAIVLYFRKDIVDLARHPGHFWQVHPGLAAASLLVLLFTSLLDLYIWNRMLGWFTAPLPFTLLAPVYMWSYLARYIPGKVGSLLLRVGLGVEARRDPMPVLAASAVELALRTASALALFFLALWSWAATQNRLLLYSLLAVIPLVLLCAHPKVMMPVLNWALKKLKQPQITQQLRYREVLGLFVALVARWVVFGLGFYLLAIAIVPDLRAQALTLTGLAPGAWAIGFMSMLPGGIGGMEAVLKAALKNLLHVPREPVFVLVLQFRLITLLGEGLWSLAAIPLWNAGRRRLAAAPSPAPETAVE